MFLNETTGMSINPAIMRQPAQFSSVIARLEGKAVSVLLTVALQRRP